MASERGYSLPVAGFSVIGVFLSALFLGPQAYDLLRVGGSEGDRRVQVTQPPIEARLWEDPFAALVRYQAKLGELCPAGGRTPQRAACGRGEVNPQAFRAQFAKDAGNLTLIAAMVPGASFVGVEETRRRTRYALLAGLNAEGYVPDDSERIGLLRTELCDSFSRCRPFGAPGSASTDTPGPASRLFAAVAATFRPRHAPKVDIPFESFSGQEGAELQDQTTASGPSTVRRVVVLWIDDATVGDRWLSAVSLLLSDLSPKPGAARLRIIGPHGSNDLLKALDQDMLSLAGEARTALPGRQLDLFRFNWRTLGDVRLISPTSTAALERLRSVGRTTPALANHLGDRLSQAEGTLYRQVAALFKSVECKDTGSSVDCVTEAFRRRFDDVNVALTTRDSMEGRPADKGGRTPAQFFVRTIGTDTRQIALLLGELCSRGLRENATGRVVLLTEWDTVYSRLFARAIQTRLAEGCPRGHPVTLEIHPYLRGVDGANLDGAPKQVRLAPRGGDKRDDRSAPQIEWPESRDQRDYVRRLASRIKEEERIDSQRRVRAIGVIGADVHDKLVLVQAFRSVFSDRLFFTTDMDARLFHPDAVDYTRNLIVASALPLSIDGTVFPSFRDLYQTSTFLAARYASAAPGASVEKVLEQIDRFMQGSHLYEIGRDGPVALSVNGIGPSELRSRRLHAAAVGVGLLVLGIIMLRFPAAAMKEALASAPDHPVRFDVGTALVAGLQAGAWFFAAGVVLELAWPGSIGPSRALLLTLAAMLCFWAFVYPGLRDLPAGWAGAENGAAPAARARRIWFRLFLLVPLFAALWIQLAPLPGAMREPFAPLAGVSAWPSQVLRTFGVVLFAWFLDYTWAGSAAAVRRVGREYFGLSSTPAAAGAFLPRSRAFTGFIEISWRRLKREFATIGSKDVWVGRLRRAGGALRDASVWFWVPGRANPDGSVDGASQWQSYCHLLEPGPRLFRVVFWFAVAVLFLVLESRLVGDADPEIPARGADDRSLILITILWLVFGTLLLLVVLADVSILTWRIITSLDKPRTIYPDDTVKAFASRLGLAGKQAEAATRRLPARIEDRVDAASAGRNTLLDDWIDVNLLAQHTKALGPLIFYPFGLVALLVVARSRLLDNWSLDGAVLAGLIAFVVWSFAMAALLNLGAEYARQRALKRMHDDLTWLGGSGSGYADLREPFAGVIDKVSKMREGAFAPFFEQPMIQAVLVPLGGAGGLKLLETFVFARP